MGRLPVCCEGFQSTLPVGGATEYIDEALATLRISIHAPRGGSDFVVQGIHLCFTYFNPRSPWGERRRIRNARGRNFRFQSTLPVGGATSVRRLHQQSRVDFNPRSPWGERPVPPGRTDVISDFNPRSPWGERLVVDGGNDLFVYISIHAPRGGSDYTSEEAVEVIAISIHAPRGGSDPICDKVKHPDGHFNPRSPWGERLLPESEGVGSDLISIHAPRGGSDT